MGDLNCNLLSEVATCDNSSHLLNIIDIYGRLTQLVTHQLESRNIQVP